MQVLTPSGYVDAETLRAGDPLCAFDADTGAPIINYLERLERWQPFVDGLRSWDCSDDSEVGPQFAPWTFYLINGTHTLFGEQSIWRNGTNVCHVRDLVVGDTIYDDSDNPIVIIGIGETEPPAVWYRFDVSGDHSYIADGVTEHNASRFCKPGAGTADWTAINTGIWAATTNGATGQSVPGSADAVTCDANFGGGTCRVNFGGAITIQSITCGAMVGTLDFSVFNNDITLSASAAFSGTGTATRTLNLGNGTWTISSVTAGATIWNFSTTTGLTFNANSSIIDFTGSVAAGNAQSMQLGALTYSTIRVSAARLNSGLSLGGGGTVGVLTNTAAALIFLSSATTVTTLTISAQLTFIVPSSATTTITNAATITGSVSELILILTSGPNDTTAHATISCASGTFSGTYCGMHSITFTGGATFSFTNSYDFGRNSGATITAPSAGGPVAQFISHQRGTPY